MAEDVGVAVFGLGRAGLYHLPNLARNQHVRVTWLVDVAGVQDKAGQLCQQYGLQHARFLVTDQCQQVFDDPRWGLVVGDVAAVACCVVYVDD